MDYVVDLDPKHEVLRITVTTAVTDEAFGDLYRALARFAAEGGPYAGILDFSHIADFPLSSETLKAFAALRPALPAGRPRVVVASKPEIYGLSRMFELHRDAMGVEVHVVRSIEEAYELLEVGPDDFTQRLFPEDVAA
jgi:hypothetical protein